MYTLCGLCPYSILYDLSIYSIHSIYGQHSALKDVKNENKRKEIEANLAKSKKS